MQNQNRINKPEEPSLKTLRTWQKCLKEIFDELEKTNPQNATICDTPPGSSS